VRRKSSLSEGNLAPFKCRYCEKAGHAKRDCPKLAEDKKNGEVKRHPWRNAEYKGKEEDRRKKVDKVKPEKVNVAKQFDSGSDSSWCVRDAGESIEEVYAKWVSGDGIEDEDISEEEAEKETNSEEVWNSEPEAQSNNDKCEKDPRVHFVKRDGFEDASEDTGETDAEEMVKQDEARNNWEDIKKE
jgi:hypothetical protein